MALFDLDDRLSWEQAARFLGVSKSAFFRMVARGDVKAYGHVQRGRFYLRSELARLLSSSSWHGPDGTLKR